MKATSRGNVERPAVVLGQKKESPEDRRFFCKGLLHRTCFVEFFFDIFWRVACSRYSNSCNQC